MGLVDVDGTHVLEGLGGVQLVSLHLAGEGVVVQEQRSVVYVRQHYLMLIPLMCVYLQHRASLLIGALFPAHVELLHHVAEVLEVPIARVVGQGQLQGS